MVSDRHGKDVTVGQRYLVTGECVGIDGSANAELRVGRQTVYAPASSLARFDRPATPIVTKPLFHEPFEYLSSDRWSSLTTGTGAAIGLIDNDTYAMGQDGSQGILNISAGTSTSGGAAILHTNPGLIFFETNHLFMQTRFRLGMGANDNIVRFGFCESVTAAGEPTKGLWVQCQRITGTQYWNIVYKTDGSGSAVATATAASANNFTERTMALVFVPDNDELQLWEDGDMESLTSTDIDYVAADDGMWRPFMQVVNNGASSASSIAVDYLQWGVMEGDYQ